MGSVMGQTRPRGLALPLLFYFILFFREKRSAITITAAVANQQPQNPFYENPFLVLLI
jgi:hypothetical protein